MSDNESSNQSGGRETRLELLLKKQEEGLLTEDDEIELRIRQGAVKEKSDYTDSIFAVIALFILATIGYNFFNRPPDLEAQAKQACQERVLELLRDPESARWTAGSAENNGDGTFSVTGNVAARNGFGGMNAPRSYTCELERKPTGGWWPASVRMY